MSGKWVYRDAENHRCPKPAGDSKTRAGDIWQCDCGLMWRVTACKGQGDQRDYYYNVTWVEHTGDVPEQNKGGYKVNRHRDNVLGGYRDR